ncbi:hypothetical protein PLAN_70477 [Planktothrix rubescens CCAP 1459/22]|uniref:Uncharacterized protein n=1 Tax=Planktothrix rubescens CCAP 1459/22 TaxID=329571 RepID=A0A6J7ZU93_PLARU|nr:hypothetical protein PLAN_70477 [Planktothrix rubescens NIVA-CYA 18]
MDDQIRVFEAFARQLTANFSWIVFSGCIIADLGAKINS